MLVVQLWRILLWVYSGEGRTIDRCRRGLLCCEKPGHGSSRARPWRGASLAERRPPRQRWRQAPPGTRAVRWGSEGRGRRGGLGVVAAQLVEGGDGDVDSDEGVVAKPAAGAEQVAALLCQRLEPPQKLVWRRHRPTDCGDGSGVFNTFWRFTQEHRRWCLILESVSMGEAAAILV